MRLSSYLKIIFFNSLVLIFILTACGKGSTIGGRKESNDRGSFKATLVFPMDIPLIESEAKTVEGIIDCSKAGIATIKFSFFSENNASIAEDSFPCNLHEASISNIPPGNNISVVVTAEDNNGLAILEGEESGITIKVNQVTESGEINMLWTDRPTISASNNPKNIAINWEHIDFINFADHYQLEVDPNGEGNFSIVSGADSIYSNSYELTVPIHLTDWANVQYRVVALDSNNNVIATSSGINPLTTITAEEIVGYFKAANLNSGDFFGYSVALSADGKILAIGAPREDSDGLSLALFMFSPSIAMGHGTNCPS